MTERKRSSQRDTPIATPNGSVRMTLSESKRYPNFALAISSYVSTETPSAYVSITYVDSKGNHIEGEKIALDPREYEMYYAANRKNHNDFIYQNEVMSFISVDGRGNATITQFTADPEIAKELFDGQFVNPFKTKIVPKRTESKNNGPITTLCYDTEDTFPTRDQAIAFYIDCVEHSEGAERDRYVNILLDLNDGKEYATDGVSQIPEYRQDKTHKSPKKVTVKTSPVKSKTKPKTTVKKTTAAKPKTTVKRTATKPKTSTKKVTKTAPKKTVKKSPAKKTDSKSNTRQTVRKN